MRWDFYLKGFVRTLAYLLPRLSDIDAQFEGRSRTQLEEKVTRRTGSEYGAVSKLEAYFDCIVCYTLDKSVNDTGG